VGYRWKGPFTTDNFCMKHFLLNQIFTRVKYKNKYLLKRNLPTPVGSAERNGIFDVTTLMTIDFGMSIIGKLEMFHCAGRMFSALYVL